MALLEITIDKGVAVLRLNRPERRNALNEELIDELINALTRMHDNKKVSCVVTVGTGNSYSTGLDLYYLKSHRGSVAPLPPWDGLGKMAQLLKMVHQYPKVTIACVNGYCLGGGLALLNCHDLAIASEEAQIGMPEIIWGSFGPFATSSLFHSGIPLKKALWIQLTGHNITGREADQIGLVSKAVKQEELMDFTIKIAHEIAGHDFNALSHGKIAAYFGSEVGLEEAMSIDHLVSVRMSVETNSLAEVGRYLASQKGGPDASYIRKGQGEGSPE